MRNHIDQVRSDFPALDRDLIDRVYQQLVVAQLRQPTRDEFRAHVAALTSDFDDATLRDMLGLPPKTSARATDGRRRTTASAGGDGGPRPRRPGRPGWTPELFWARYREASARCAPPHSFRAVAVHFDTLDGVRGIDPDHLRKLARRFGLPPE